MTTTTLVNNVHNSYSNEPNLSANLGFRPQTASATTMLKMPNSRLSSKSQKLLRNSVTGNTIKFRHMSSSSNLGNPNDAVTATGTVTVASRSNSQAGFQGTRIKSRGSNSVFRNTAAAGPGYMTGGGFSNS